MGAELRIGCGFSLNVEKYVVQLKAVKSACCVHAAFVFAFMLCEDVGWSGNSVDLWERNSAKVWVLPLMLRNT